LTKGFWAISDQGLFATSNFALNVLLARWISPYDYGAFSVTFAIFMLIGVVHTATLTEPMLVYGPGKYKDRFSEYLGIVIHGHLGIAALGSLLLLLGSLGLALFGLSSLSVTLVALAFAEPFILLLWLMRRACYARLEPQLAASGGALYMILMLAGAYVLYRGEWLSAASAFGVMGLSSLVVSVWLLIRLRVKPSPLRRSELARDSLENHWQYGRWSVANEGLNWVPMNIYFVLLPIFGGLEAGAAFKALMNPIMPMLQAIWALAILLLPILVRARDEGGTSGDGPRFSSRVRLALVPFVLGPVLYWLALGLFHHQLVDWLYGGRYTEQAALLWLLGLSPIVAAVKQVMGQSLKALERPDRLFWAYAFSAVLTLTLGAGFVYLWGVVGAGIGFVGSQGVTALLALILYRRLRASEHQAPSAKRAPRSVLGRRYPANAELRRKESNELA
jgi:O-antigen/teichoic acid export membrane protein